MARDSKQHRGLGSGIITGRVIGHRDGFGFLVPDNGEDDLYLNQRQMRKVFHGDRVRASIIGLNERGKLEARIEEVLEHGTRELVGRFYQERGISFVRPDNRHIATDLLIPTGAEGGAKGGQIVVAEVVEQPSRYAPATGRITEVLGDHLSPGMEIEVAIRNAGIPQQWPDEVLEEADELGSQVQEYDKRGRIDWRELPFVTIDGADARDFDDAVFCERDGKGWHLYVAIADVSHYVHPKSALDEEAENRGTSVYFPDYVVPMLPEVLSNGLCSLKPKVDRLALVCDMRIDGDGGVVEYHFCEAVIRSHERLTYDRVQKVIDGDPLERQTLVDLVPDLLELHTLYKTLLRARQRRGALDFDSMETRILFDAQRKIEQIVPVERKDAHRLIEECMLCANICAANLLLEYEIPALYRVHAHPKSERLDALRDYLTTLGLWLGGGEQPTPDDFRKLVASLHERPDRAVIETMILRSQQQAVYQPENIGHFGLAYPAYTHFTSPIRRYPDLLVHRAIRSLIRSRTKAKRVRRVDGVEPMKKARIYPYDLEALKALGTHCSMTERRAEEATRDVEQWLKCEYLSAHIGSSFPAVVTTVTGFGLFVQLEELFIEGLVHISTLPADYYQFDPAHHSLTGERSRRTFRMADELQVVVAAVSLDDRKIDLVLDAAAMSIDTSGERPRPAHGRARAEANDRSRGKRGKKGERDSGGKDERASGKRKKGGRGSRRRGR